MGGVDRGQVNNSIVWGNTAPTNANYSADSLMNYSCTAPLPTNGIGNIEVDPQFVSSNDFHLASFSPCIDVGNNAFVVGSKDLDGSARILDGDANGSAMVDMGCYEFLNPLADSDSDHMKDGDEVIAGTNPADSNDYFRVLKVSHSSPAGTEVFFDSLDSRQYQLFWRSNLLEGVWYPVTTTPQMGAGGIDSLSDTNDEASVRFYRLEVSLP